MQDTIPIPKNGAVGQLGHWIDPDDLETELNMRFPGCMKGNKDDIGTHTTYYYIYGVYISDEHSNFLDKYDKIKTNN